MFVKQSYLFVVSFIVRINNRNINIFVRLFNLPTLQRMLLKLKKLNFSFFFKIQKIFTKNSPPLGDVLCYLILSIANDFFLSLSHTVVNNQLLRHSFTQNYICFIDIALNLIINSKNKLLCKFLNELKFTFFRSLRKSAYSDSPE